MKLKKYTSCYNEDTTVVDQTQTPEFKKWFGRSQIKKSGKPLIVYHGTNQTFSYFKDVAIGSNSGNFGHFGYGFYFSFDKREAGTYGKNIIPVYLRIEKPFYANVKNLSKYAKEFGGYEKVPVAFDLKWLLNSLKKIDIPVYNLASLIAKNGYEKGWALFLKSFNPEDEKFDWNIISDWMEYINPKEQVEIPDHLIDQVTKILGEPVLIYDYPFSKIPQLHYMTDFGNNAQEFTDQIKKDGYDGIVSGSEIVVFHPNQIKSTTGNNGNFSRSSNNIYEDITIPLEKGDTFRAGKFKNKSYVYDSHYINDKGDVIIRTANGKEIPACKIRLVREEALEEELHLSDFKGHSGVSDFTKPFLKDRIKKKGGGTTSTKIKALKVNRKQDYITFVFQAVPTYDKTVKVYDPKTQTQRRARSYLQQVRLKDFFKYAQTKPGYDEKNLTRKEIKEILNVCPISVFCNCFSFQFQGMAYVDTIMDASIYDELRPPERWRKYHSDNSFACKHLSQVFTSIDFYLNNMSAMINKYLKSK